MATLTRFSHTFLIFPHLILTRIAMDGTHKITTNVYTSWLCDQVTHWRSPSLECGVNKSLTVCHGRHKQNKQYMLMAKANKIGPHGPHQESHTLFDSY